MPRTQAAAAVRGRSDKQSNRETNSSQKTGSGRRERGAGGSRGGSPVKSSHVIEEHIDLGVPRDVAFDQWTRYKDLAKYTKKESAQQKRPDRVSFRSKIGPSSRGWDAQIVEQVPGRRIAWRSIGGARHMGVITFHSLDDRLTRMMVQMEYHPSGALETIGNFLRMQRRRVRKDLRLFKHFIDLRGEATGKGTRERVRGEGLRQETDDRLESEKSEGKDQDEEARADNGRDGGKRKAS